MSRKTETIKLLDFNSEFSIRSRMYFGPQTIKSEISYLRRRLKNRKYSRTKRENDNSSCLKLEKPILELEKRIEGYENFTENNVKPVIDIALEKTYPESLPAAKYYIDQEILGEEREVLIHSVNEIER